MNGRKWEEWEKDFVRLTYPLFRLDDIAKILNRTESSIEHYCNRNKIKKYIIKIGDKFNRLTIIKLNHIDKNNHCIWLCQCECGNKTFVSTSSLRNETIKSCGCFKRKGYKNISGHWYCTLKISAKRRNIKFNISIEFLNTLIENQKFKCALSGLPIQISKTSKNYYKNTTASLDRINSLNGYAEDNVQFVHKDINKIKMDLDQNYFIELCTKVVEYAK